MTMRPWQTPSTQNLLEQKLWFIQEKNEVK